MGETWEHKFVQTNGIRLHCVVQGQGKPMIMLHGFPEFWYSWRHQIPIMAKHFKVIAPDMRGYNQSDKPEGAENYRMNLLVKDVIGLMESFGEEKAIIVGHDWGAIVSWALAMARPEAIERLIIMNAPHPAVWQERAKYIARQLQKSWYIFFFQKEQVPESYFCRNNHLALQLMLSRSTVREGVFSGEDLKKYMEAWSKPGALTASINYYRANIKPEIFMKEVSFKFPKITSPTLVIWAEDDLALTMEMSKGAEKYVDASYTIKYIPKCGHWVQNEEPELVNRHILEFLSDYLQ